MGQSDSSLALAALLQLLHRARDAESAVQLGFVMVNETVQLLPYRQAAFWREGVFQRIEAVSGLSELDPTAPYIQWLGRVFRHLQHAEGEGDCRALTANALPDALAAEWAESLPTHALYLPLARHGALLLARDLPWSEYERQLAAELAHGYTHALKAFAPRVTWRRSVRNWTSPGPRRRKLLLAALVVALFPIRLSVLARAEVVAQDPLLVRAPLAGVIDRISVQPNQVVNGGQALFDLDATTLAGQYAMAREERDAAEERYRASSQLAVTDDKGKQSMALDRARFEEKSITADYTGRALQRLHVSAPQAGVVVFSDRNDWQGRAVAVGEKVMTLANPKHVELAAWLPAAEAIELKPGARVTLYPNASPTSSFDARLIRVAYKAEPVEGGLLAYRLQARFDAGERRPQLGQMGTARVYGDWVPLCYYALRRPLTGARQWLGW